MILEDLAKQYGIPNDILDLIINEVNTYNYDIQNISVLEKICKFIYFDFNTYTKEVYRDSKLSQYDIYDISLNQFSSFDNYVKSLNKYELALFDNNNIFKIKGSPIYISRYKDDNLIKEYFNYLLFSFNQNISAMEIHLYIQKSPDKCGFFGFKQLIHLLYANINYFKDVASYA